MGENFIGSRFLSLIRSHDANSASTSFRSTIAGLRLKTGLKFIKVGSALWAIDPELVRMPLMPASHANVNFIIHCPPPGRGRAAGLHSGRMTPRGTHGRNSHEARAPARVPPAAPPPAARRGLRLRCAPHLHLRTSGTTQPLPPAA